MNVTMTCASFDSLGIIVTNCTDPFSPNCSLSKKRCVAETRPWTLVLLVLSSYLTFAVMLYEIRHRKRKQTARVNRIYAVSVYLTLAFAMSCVIAIHRGSYSICLGHKFVSMFLYAASTVIIYTLLWTRQRLLHKGHLMGSVTCTLDNKLSFSIIAGIYATFAFLLVVFFGTVCQVVTRNSCLVTYASVTQDFYLKGAMIAFLCTGLIFRLGLLALMAHPLRKGTRNACNASEREISKLLRRLFFSTAVCVTTSTIFAVSIFLDVYEVMCINWEVPGGFDMLASNIAIIFTFTDGMQRVFPFCRQSRLRCKNARPQAQGP